VLSRLARWSLDRPWLIAGASLWLLVFGLLFARDLKVALLPDIAPAQAIVQTQAPGLVAEQVEQLVTRPVETALEGAAGVVHVHSQSEQGLSTITVTLAERADPQAVRQTLQERLGGLSAALPAGVGAPRLLPLAAVGGEALRIGFTSDRLDPMALRDLVEWTVRPRLLAAPGVARVNLYGGQTRRIEVRARPADLADSDLGFLDMLAAVRRATGVAGAGFIDTPTQRVAIDPHGQALTPDDVGAGQIQTPGAAPVRINDVADVAEAPAPAFGDALIDGKPGVLASVAAQYGANRIDVTHAVEAALQTLRPALAKSDVRADDTLDRPATFITRTVRGVTADLLVGAVLIAIALILLLRDARAALVAFLGIPIALMLAVMAVKAAGWTINAMTLGGLAVALGVMIDDALIDVENILARLREAEQRHASRTAAIVAACVEVRGPVIYATLAIIVAIAPLLALGGALGALLRPMAGAIVAGCLASLIVAAALTPALAKILLGHVRPVVRPAPNRLDAAYRRTLARLASAPRAVMLVALGILVAVAVVTLLLVRPALLPAIHDGQLTAQITAPPSTSLEAMRDYGVKITGDLRRLAGVSHVSMRSGRDPTGDDGAGLESAAFDIVLAPGLDAAGQEAVAERVRGVLDLYPGLDPVVASRFDADGDGGGASAPFRVTIYGPDLDALDASAATVAATLKALPGGETARVESGLRAPVVRVDVNFQRLAIQGLSDADVLDTLRAAFAGERVAQVYAGDRAIDLAVTAQDSLRRDPEAVGDLLLRSTTGFAVPLRSVANVYLTDGRAEILHDNGLRRQSVIVEPPPGQAARFAAEARRAVAAKVSPPAGMFIEIAEADGGAAEAGRGLLASYGLAAFAILALLAVAFDIRAAAVILVSTLFAFAGGAVAVLAVGGEPSVGAMAGFIALLGLSMRGAILLITRVEDLVAGGGASWSFAAVARATRERVEPLAMSAILVALALAPFALRPGAAGHEILGPMAIVIIAGLAASLAASLFVTPVLIYSLWRPGRPRLSEA